MSKDKVVVDVDVSLVTSIVEKESEVVYIYMWNTETGEFMVKRFTKEQVVKTMMRSQLKRLTNGEEYVIKDIEA